MLTNGVSLIQESQSVTAVTGLCGIEMSDFNSTATLGFGCGKLPVASRVAQPFGLTK
jgi:hypothetical protein